MTEERLKVLEILQDGKINAEDAARLLEALNKLPADGGGAVKVKVETHQDEDGGDMEAIIEEEMEEMEEEIEKEIEEEMEGIEEEIEKEIEEEMGTQVGEDVKLKIKVKMNQNEDV